jgi:hypothetical protein
MGGATEVSMVVRRAGNAGSGHMRYAIRDTVREHMYRDPRIWGYVKLGEYRGMESDCARTSTWTVCANACARSQRQGALWLGSRSESSEWDDAPQPREKYTDHKTTCR